MSGTKPRLVLTVTLRKAQCPLSRVECPRSQGNGGARIQIQDFLPSKCLFSIPSEFEKWSVH